MGTDLAYQTREVRENRKDREEAVERQNIVTTVYRSFKELLMEEYDIGIFPAEYCRLTNQDKERVIKSRESEGKSFYFCRGCGSLNCIGYPPGYVTLSQEQKKQVNEWKEFIRRVDEERGITWENEDL